MYGAMQATLARQGVTGDQHAAMHARAFACAAASGQYPNLAAALATAGPPRGDDAIFESSIMRLGRHFVIGYADLGQNQHRRPVRVMTR